MRISTGETTIATTTVTVGCQTIHTTMAVASIVVITEAGVAIASRHHGTIIQATVKVMKIKMSRKLNFNMLI